jgi:hypothetical protein
MRGKIAGKRPSGAPAPELGLPGAARSALETLRDGPGAVAALPPALLALLLLPAPPLDEWPGRREL